MWLADLHVHSTFSDGKLTIPELVDLYGERGFGALAITDHLCEENKFLGQAAKSLGRTLTRLTFPLYMSTLESEAERAWKTYQMLLIPGVELTKNSLAHSRSAHILGIGIQDFISADAKVEDITRAIRAQGAISVAAHPVSTRRLEPQTYHLWSRRQELAPEFDAWEVASGPVLFNEVLQSGLPMIASSDLHHPKQMSSWKTVFHCARTRESVLQAVRDQEVTFQFYQETSTDQDALISWAGRLGLAAFRERSSRTLAFN